MVCLKFLNLLIKNYCLENHLFRTERTKRYERCLPVTLVLLVFSGINMLIILTTPHSRQQNGSSSFSVVQYRVQYSGVMQALLERRR